MIFCMVLYFWSIHPRIMRSESQNLSQYLQFQSWGLSRQNEQIWNHYLTFSLAQHPTTHLRVQPRAPYSGDYHTVISVYSLRWCQVRYVTSLLYWQYTQGISRWRLSQASRHHHTVRVPHEQSWCICRSWSVIGVASVSDPNGRIQISQSRSRLTSGGYIRSSHACSGVPDRAWLVCGAPYSELDLLLIGVRLIFFR